jgi:hypothetical protein
MQSERRWNERHPVAINIVVYYSGLGLIQGKTKNLSIDGTFIDTGRITLHQGGEVDLILYDPADSSTQQRVRARIVRLDDDGAGMVFRDIPLGAYELLRRALNRPATDAINEAVYQFSN